MNSPKNSKRPADMAEQIPETEYEILPLQKKENEFYGLKTVHIIPAVIILYLIQFFLIQDKRILYDECWTAVPVYNSDRSGGFAVSAVAEDNMPTAVYQFTCYQLILKGAHYILPESITYSRIVNSIFVPLILLLVYYTGLRIFRNKAAAALPPLILAADNVYFLASYIVRPDYLLAAGIPVILLLVYDRQWNVREKYAIHAGVISGLLAGMHPNFVLAVIAFIITSLVINPGRLPLKKNLIIICKYTSGAALPVLAVVLYAVIRQSNYTPDTSDYFYSFLRKTTTINAEMDILNPLKLITEEWRRYDEFLQYYFRSHILLLYTASAVYALWKGNRVIRQISAMTLIILFLFMLLIANKNARYFSLVLPMQAVLTAWMFFDLRQRYMAGRKKLRHIAYAAFSLIIISMLAGNVYLIAGRWNTSYSDLQNGLKIEYSQNDTIAGDLLLWDIFKKSNFLSYMSDEISLSRQSYDYVILGGRKSIQDKKKEYFERNIFPKLNKVMIRKYSNPYYGEFRIYRIIK